MCRRLFSWEQNSARRLKDRPRHRSCKDLDFFHDSEQRVASAFEEDQALLLGRGFTVEVDLRIPGYVRTVVRKNKEATRVEWAHDSAWRFLPTIRDPECGFRLHPIDNAVNKVLALVGRDEPRDLLDTIDVDRRVLPLGALRPWGRVLTVNLRRPINALFTV